MFDNIILSCINILSKCYTFAYYKCFFSNISLISRTHPVNNLGNI